MLIDITGTELTPGNLGKDCLGNGTYKGQECCCDECDYMLCCIDENWKKACISCKEMNCPRKSFSI